LKHLMRKPEQRLYGGYLRVDRRGKPAGSRIVV
jgi:hypothetical protein